MTLHAKRFTMRHHYFITITRDGRFLKRQRWKKGMVKAINHPTEPTPTIDLKVWRVQHVFGFTEHAKEEATPMTSTIRIWVYTYAPDLYDEDKMRQLAFDIIQESTGDIGKIINDKMKLQVIEGIERRLVSKGEMGATSFDMLKAHIIIKKRKRTYEYDERWKRRR